MAKLTYLQLRKLVAAGALSATSYFLIKKARRMACRATHVSNEAFQLSSFEDNECLHLFRFTKPEIYVLLKALGIPAKFTLVRGNVFSGLEGLCILLRRLAYPNRLSDLEPLFARDAGTLSRICNWMTTFIYSHHGHHLRSLKQRWLTKDKLEEFAEKCCMAGSAYGNLVGFIDGIGRAICRPSRHQQVLYSGYKKQHLLKYQSVMYPNGIIGRLDGAFIGKRHDAAILELSHIKDEMRKVFTNSDGTYYALYGDPGYSNQKYIKVGYKKRANQVLSDAHKQFNAVMARLSVSVEYGFGHIVQQFVFLDFKKNQKVYLQPVKQQYFVAALLVNLQTCLRGNRTSQYFNCAPPTVAEYLA